MADGPLPVGSAQKLESEDIVQNANFSPKRPKRTPNKAYRQVALIGVLDRPVFLPVPVSHANLQAIVAYLGQPASVANEVKSCQWAKSEATPTGKPYRTAAFSVPTVLYFNPAGVQAGQVPKFPEVYRIGPTDRRTLAPQTLPTPKLSFPPEDQSPPTRFQRPAHSVVESSAASAEPALFSKTQDLRSERPSAGTIETIRKHWVS